MRALCKDMRLADRTISGKVETGFAVRECENSIIYSTFEESVSIDFAVKGNGAIVRAGA